MRLLFASVFILFLFIAIRLNSGSNKLRIAKSANKTKEIRTKLAEERIASHVVSLKKFIKKNNYNQDICFLMDLEIASGYKRFFIYDLKKDKVINSGLVAHGSGSETGDDELYCSNKPGSLCTSTGRYKIGYSYNGTFGLAYKLYGLDETNSKAFERFVVLHAHKCIPDEETDGDDICLSWGCPTVSISFLQMLKEKIENSRKPIILWIYN